MKLFCIPFAGGTAQFFKPLEEVLENRIEIYAIEYAGHGYRTKEPFYKTFDEMVEDVTGQIRRELEPGEKFALFGYSLGSLVAYETARRMGAVHVFLAAHAAPSIRSVKKGFHDLPDEEYADVLSGYGDIDPRIRNNKRFLNLYLRPSRADYALLEEYPFDEKHPAVATGATMFYSSEDTGFETVKPWKECFSERFEWIELSGKHFFLRQHLKEIANIIEETIKETMKETIKETGQPGQKSGC